MAPFSSHLTFCNASPLPNEGHFRRARPSVQQRPPLKYVPIIRRISVAMAVGWATARSNPIPSFKESVKTTGYIPGAPIEEPLQLSIHDLLAIVKSETPDSWPNEIIRLLLGWRQNEDASWDSSHVPEEWKKQYPNAPPDFIGDPTDYSRERDMPVKLAVAKLTRSILPEHKNGFREVMKPAGFPGFKVKDLTPNRTRRAVCVNYIIFWYRIHFPDYIWQ